MRLERKFGSKILLLTSAIVFTACGSDLDGSLISSAEVCTLTVDAVKSPSAGTRALAPDGNTITATWSTDDRVTVLNASHAVIGTMTPFSIDGSKARLKAVLNSPVHKDDQLTLLFPKTVRDYTGQKGTLDDIASNYDFATASVKVNYADDSFVSASDAHFVNQQAIVRFSLQDKSSNAISASSLTIAADGLRQNATTTGAITITPVSPASEIYAALSGLNGIVTLTATVGKKEYTHTTSAAKFFGDGQFYSVTCKMQTEPVAYTEPLTLECYDPQGCRVTVSAAGDLEYSRDGSTWKAFPRQVTLNQGEKVSLRGNNATQSQSSQYMNIACNGLCYIYGNIMSLLSKEDYATMTELPYSNTFQNLFMNNTFISHMEGKDLVLPAKKLLSNCYYQMFSGCNNLNYVKCLATDISARGCTTNWLKGVSRKGTFVKAADFDGWSTFDPDNGIPEGWTVLNE